MSTAPPPSPDDDAGKGAAWPKGLRTSFLFPHEPKQRPKPAAGLSAGQVVGDFRLVEMIGQGGMGQVWEAEQISLGGRPVAVKFVRPERVSTARLDFFRREARAGGRLSHPGIVAIHGYGEAGELAWIGMELVPGDWTLSDSIDRFAEAEVLPEGYHAHAARLIAEVADAMQAAHDAGVIHRDLKPQNILITPKDRPKVTDFGLARITDETAVSDIGEFAGSYAYMSPEQVAAKRAGLDHRTDIFSLGATLFELLTLKRPFTGDSALEISQKILFEEPPPPRELSPEIPEPLAAACLRSLEKQPDARFQTMAAFAEALRAAVSNSGNTGVISATSPPRLREPKLPEVARPRSKRTIALGLAILTAAAFATTQILPGTQQPSDPQQADTPETSAAAPGSATATSEAIVSSDEWSYPPKLVAYAKERIAEADKDLAAYSQALADDPMRQRLRALTIPSVTIPPTSSLTEALGAVPELSEFNFFVQSEVERSLLDEGFIFDLQLQYPITAFNLLNLLLAEWSIEDRSEAGIGWQTEKDAIAFRPIDITEPIELVSWPVGDLIATLYEAVQTFDDEGTPQGWARNPIRMEPDDLIILITENAARTHWGGRSASLYGPSIEIYSGLLLIANRPSLLIEVEQFLRNLRQITFVHESDSSIEWASSFDPKEKASAINEQLHSVRLQLPVEPGELFSLVQLVSAIEASLSVDVVFESSLQDLYKTESPPSAQLDIAWETAEELLKGIQHHLAIREDAPQTIFWSVRHGVLFLGSSDRSLTGRMYRVQDLMGAPSWSDPWEQGAALLPPLKDEKDEKEERLQWREMFTVTSDTIDLLIRFKIEPESWEADPRHALRVTDQGILVVTQTLAVHEAIEKFLADLRAVNE